MSRLRAEADPQLPQPTKGQNQTPNDQDAAPTLTNTTNPFWIAQPNRRNVAPAIKTATNVYCTEVITR